MLTVAGFFTSSRDLAKASQININLNPQRLGWYAKV